MTITALIFLYVEKKRDVVKSLEISAMHSVPLRGRLSVRELKV